MWQWYDSQIVNIQQQSPNTRLFTLKIASETPFDFKAGQFVTMDLPISEKRLKRWRSYSIANAPNLTQNEASNADDTEGGKILEFSIVHAENSTGGSRYLFEEATIGTPIKFKGPDGAFTLRSNLAEKDAVFICTGTGVAPFRSMLWDIYHHSIPHRKLHLIFGARHEADILFREEFEFLQQNLPNFHYDVALSRDKNWQGHQGYVHGIYTRGYAEVRSDVQFYICGWSKMIDDAVAKLMVDMSFDKSQIIYELYG